MVTRPTILQRVRVWAAAVLLAAGAAMVWTGCSVERNYKTLSFFFDGVPDPHAATQKADLAQARGPGGILRPQVVYYSHKPYVEQKCDACHGARLSEERGVPGAGIETLVAAATKTCTTCHTTVQREYPIVHGPVAVAACNWCHVPHESRYPYLLKAPAVQVCLQCHEKIALSQKVPEHVTAEQSCIDCHSGHGGIDHRFMKVPRPATQPAPAVTPTTVPALSPPAMPGPSPLPPPNFSPPGSGVAPRDPAAPGAPEKTGGAP